MARFCFVSYEIAPTTWGGAGVLLANSAKLLLEQGHEVIFVLDVPEPYYKRFQWHDRFEFPNPHMVRAYHVSALCADLPYTWDDFRNTFLWRAYRFHWAAHKVALLEKPDVIEFVDYCGVGYFALHAKVTLGAYEGCHLAVRLHNTLEGIDLEEPSLLDEERFVLHVMERQALRMAESVLTPSLRYYREAVSPIYGNQCLGEVRVSPPAMLHQLKPVRDGGPKDTILFFGRLFGFKGVDRFVHAAVQFLAWWDAEGKGDLKVILVGNDSRTSPEGEESYWAYLERMIPSRFRERFEFKGHLRGSDLDAVLDHVLFAVFPNYFESFCYAAHELYEAGAPLILSKVPTFQEYFRDGQSALFFDGSVRDLFHKMRLLATDEDLRAAIKRPYAVLPTPLGDFYSRPPRKSWMSPADKGESVAHLLVCVVDDGTSGDELTITLRGIPDEERVETIILSSEPTCGKTVPVSLLGGLYFARTSAGQALGSEDLLTREALVLLRAGDRLDPKFLSQALDVLSRRPEVGFVLAWRRVDDLGRRRLEAYPFDGASFAFAFRPELLPTRAVMRTEPDKRLSDLFDVRLRDLGEVAYLWDLQQKSLGVMLPEPLLEVKPTPCVNERRRLATLFLLQRLRGARQGQITEYLLARHWEAKASQAAEAGLETIEPDRRAYLELAELIR